MSAAEGVKAADTKNDALKAQLEPYFDQGLELWLESGALRFKAPKELLSKPLMSLLKANKADILAWLQTESESEPQIAAELIDEYPLAYTQGAIWMLYKFAPNSPAYNTTFACVLAAQVNEDAVRQAFHALLIRHPVLRTTFADTELGARQQVWSHIPMPLQIVDGSVWDAPALQDYLDKEADAPFDLSNEPCLRVKIVRNSVKGDILIATIQHVGADLWALLIVAQDIKTFYETAARGDAVSVQPVVATYRQHVEWQQSFMDSEAGKRQRRFWQRQLQGAPITVSLPSDFQRPPVLQLQTQVFSQVLGPETYHPIKAYCKNSSITAFVFVQAAFQLMVQHHTRANDFLLGTPTMGRSGKGMDQVVGDFANPVVLRAQPDLSESLKTHFRKVKQTLLAAMDYQECPFPIVVQDCNPPRDSSRTPLFQLMLVWHQGNAEMLPKDGFIADVLPMSGPRGAPYDVMLAVSDLGDQFELNWTYQTSMYTPATIENYNQQLQLLFTQMMAADTTETGDPLSGIVQRVFYPDSVASDLRLTPPQVSDAAQIRYDLERDRQSELKGLDHCIVRQTLETGRVLNRLFIAADQAQLNGLDLSAFDDVYPLPRLPRNSLGEVDQFQLLRLPVFDRTALADQLQAQGLSHKQLVLMRDSVPLPTFTADEVQQALRSEVTAIQAKTETAAIAANLLPERDDAWMVGEPLAGDQPSHLFEALRHTATRYPEKGLLFLPNDSEQILYRYSQLLEDAYIAASGFKRAGIQAGEIVLLQMRFDQPFFAVWWGAVLAGIRPLVVATPEQYSKRNGVAQKLYNVAHNFAELVVAADSDRVEQTAEWLGDNKKVIDAGQLLKPIADSAGYEFNGYHPDPVAFLQLTSGSTGTPKAIQITHKGVLHHVAGSAKFNGYHTDDISLNWLPFDHVVPILTTHLKDVVLGIQQIQLPTARVLADPLLWLKTVSRFKVVFSWAPNFAFQRVIDALKSKSDLPDLDLSSVKIIMNAGEQVLAPVVKNFTAALSPYGLHADAVQPAFGMAEACTCMTYNNNSSQQIAVYFRTTDDPAVVDVVSQQASTHGFVDLGSVIPGVEVRITDAHNQLVKEGVIGRMQIRGPVITPGYLNNPDANSESFVGEGWFNSGDLGLIWNKRLILTGREKEMIVVNGANYYCFELEQAVTDLPGVVPTFVAATGVSSANEGGSEALVLFYVSDGSQDSTQLERKIIARVSESFGVVAGYAIEVQADEFYKTTSGKIQRSQFKKQFESGFYQQAKEAFEARHSAPVAVADTAYTVDWSVVPVEGDGDTNVVTLLQQTDQERLTAVLNGTDTSALLVDLGRFDDIVFQFSSEVDAKDLSNNPVVSRNDNGFMLAKQLSWLTRALKESGHQKSLTLWSQTGSADVLWLLKPLLESVQQESGNSAVAWIVTPTQTVPAIRRNPVSSGVVQKGSVVWQNDNLQRQLLLNSIAPAAIPGEPVDRYGVYLISGGLGGLAEPLCEYLVQQRKAKVILAGRSELSAHPQKQARLNQLKARFGESKLQYVMLPDWQPRTLQTQIASALQKCEAKQLNGIFHLAGQLSMQSLEDLTESHWREAVQAKIEGTYNLASYLNTHWPRSIFVQYGSINGFFGGQNAAAYSFSNAVQSRLTNILNSSTRIRSWCLNWSVWQGTGMATGFSQVELQMARNKGFVPLSESRDSVWLEKLLQLPPQNYFVGLDSQHAEIRQQSSPFCRSKQQWNFYLESAEDASGYSDMDAIRQLIQQHIVQPYPQVQSLDLEFHAINEAFPRDSDGALSYERLRQLGQLQQQQADQGEQPETETEQAIAAIWSDILGQPVNDVTRSFFEYGGHSINATQVIASINNKLALPVTVAHLFQYPTIRELAAVVSQGAMKDRLSLTLNDCLQRANRYRFDEVNDEENTGQTLVFLPTALGVPAVYGQMIGALSGCKLMVASMPFNGTDRAGLQQAAAEFIQLLKQADLDNNKTMLVGWSLAGVLGYELLRQLSSAAAPQDTLPKLIMLDSGFADGLHEITFDNDFQLLMFAVELGLGMEHFAEFNRQPDPDTKIHWLKQYLETIGIEVDELILLEWWSAYESRLHSLLTYKTEKTLIQNADISLLKASLHTHGRTDLGWDDENNIIKWTSVQEDHQGIVKSAAVIDWIQTQLQ